MLFFVSFSIVESVTTVNLLHVPKVVSFDAFTFVETINKKN